MRLYSRCVESRLFKELRAGEVFSDQPTDRANVAWCDALGIIVCNTKLQRLGIVREPLSGRPMVVVCLPRPVREGLVRRIDARQVNQHCPTPILPTLRQGLLS